MDDVHRLQQPNHSVDDAMPLIIARFLPGFRLAIGMTARSPIGLRTQAASSAAARLLGLALAAVFLSFSPARAGDAELCNQSLAAPDQGIPACTRLLSQNPNSADAPRLFNNRGVAKISRGDYADAVADFTSALDRDPNNVDAFRNRGMAWQRASDFDKAVADFTRAIKINPKAEALYNARGAALFSKEEFAGAIEDFNRAIALNKRFAPAYLNRGTAYQYRRRLDDALADFTQYIELAPNDTRGFTNRAFARMDKADFEGAILDYTEAIKRNPNAWAAFSGRGEAERLRGDLDSALADHNQAVALDANPQTYVNRALLLQSRGDFDAAIADCSQAILLDPRFALAYSDRGVIQTQMGDLRSALADLDKAVALDPKSPMALTFRGNALREAGRIPEAIADFDAALRNVVDFVAGYTGRGLAYERKGDLEAARRDYQAALNLPAAIDYALAKPAQDLAKKRLALLDERKAADSARAAQAAADLEAGRRAQAERSASNASVDRETSEKAARVTAEAERVARENFEAKVRAEANAKVAELTRTAQERMDAELRVRSAADASARAEYEARVKAQAEAQAKADYETQLKAEVEARVKAQTETQAKTAAEANLKVQTASMPVRPPERRIALIIGNSAYRNVPALANPHQDAQAVADVLRKVGFQLVDVEFDLSREDFIATIRRFEDEVDHADWALIYYAGHGIEANGRNYMIPIDAKLKSDRDILDETIPLDRILTATERARKLRLVVLDACRDNPFAASMRRSSGWRVSTGGLARIEPDGGSIVAYAARDGSVALDGKDGHSPFTSAFVRTVVKPGLEVNMMFRSIHDQVLTDTRKQQEPITYGSLSGDSFYFVNN